jgi:hypothetical protein
MESALIVEPKIELDWMKRICQADEVVSGLSQITPVRNKQGHWLVEHPHVLAVGHDIAMVHRGEMPGFAASYAPPRVVYWTTATFFQTKGLVGVETMSIDALHRLGDIKPASRKTCTRCGGSKLEPDAVADGDGKTLACTECDGEGTVVVDDDGLEKIGQVTINRRALAPLVKHLVGAEAGVAYAPSTDRP